MQAKTKTFQKTKENFTCKKCGFKVVGTGYTNHCPHCLWSRHVDINPGDRKESCKGLMKPISIDLRSGEYTITHQCVVCGVKKKNKASKEDSFDMLIKISKPSKK
jgi:hypothetical protein